MTVTCPECRSVFRVDPAKVPVSGVRARCAVCGGIIAIAGGTLPVTVAHEASIGARAATSSLAGGSSRGVGAFDAAAGAPLAGSVAATPAVLPVAAAPSPVPPVPAPPVTAPPVTAPPVVVPPSVVPPAVVPPAVVPRQPTPAYTDIPVAFPVFGRTHATPASVPTVSAAGAVMSPEVPPAPSWEAPPGPPAVAAVVSAPSTLPGSGARVSINPFLRADPDTRARRLARALVSDLVAYHPLKREEGVREGTLRQLFRDDIRKSYEEYVEQVGREVAEQSRHFQDALNDILAGGRALF
jgi:predicted Zn finger-like uncharacterized protein